MSEPSTAVTPQKRKRHSHVWAREDAEHYVENRWCSERLFQCETFTGTVWDPACGFGRITDAARAHGLEVHESDLVDRGRGYQLDFLTSGHRVSGIVSNPPFNLFKEFALHALSLATDKVALIWQVPRLNAAGSWLRDTPLRRIWLMTPRPSMPPGHVVLELEAQGKKPRGGTQDYAWLVFEHGWSQQPEVRWLHRERPR